MRCVYPECPGTIEFMCKCTSEPIYLCYAHIKKHKNEPGKHVFEEPLIQDDTTFVKSIVIQKLGAIQELVNCSTQGFRNVINSITLAYQCFSSKLAEVERNLYKILNELSSNSSGLVIKDWQQILSENCNYWECQRDLFSFHGALNDIQYLLSREIPDCFIPIPSETTSIGVLSFDQLFEKFLGINRSLTKVIYESVIEKIPVSRTWIEEIPEIKLKDFEETKIFEYEANQVSTSLIQGILSPLNGKETICGEFVYACNPGWEIDTAGSEIEWEMAFNVECFEPVFIKRNTMASCSFKADIPKSRLLASRFTLKVYGKIKKIKIRRIENEYNSFELNERVLERIVKLYESEHDARSAAMQQALEIYSN